MASSLLMRLGMNPKAQQLRRRTRKFHNRVIALCERLPDSVAARRITPQLLDSAGSTDSNYRGACRGRSRKEFIAKMGVAAEEADESKGWLEALQALHLGDAAEIEALIKEADELIAIFVASEKTAKKNASKKPDAREIRNRQ